MEQCNCSHYILEELFSPLQDVNFNFSKTLKAAEHHVWAQYVHSFTPPPDLISQLLDPVVDPWLDRETCYNSIHVPESYAGPRLSFPLSVLDTNTLLSAFKEQQVQECVCLHPALSRIRVSWFDFGICFSSPQTLHARYVLQLLYETKKLLKQMPNIIHLSTSYTKEITICGRRSCFLLHCLVEI